MFGTHVETRYKTCKTYRRMCDVFGEEWCTQKILKNVLDFLKMVDVVFKIKTDLAGPQCRAYLKWRSSWLTEELQQKTTGNFT